MIMSANTVLPTRLKAGSPGLGQASQVEIEQRAAELAVSDGRELVSDGDLATAAAELAGGGTTAEAPEADVAIEQVTVWDEPPPQTGHLVATSVLEDESNIAQHLVADGLEEADHDIRTAAETVRRES